VEQRKFTTSEDYFKVAIEILRDFPLTACTLISEGVAARKEEWREKLKKEKEGGTEKK